MNHSGKFVIFVSSTQRELAAERRAVKRFVDVPDLISIVYASLVQYLDEHGMLQSRPFDERVHADASLADLDETSLKQFVGMARHERQFALAESATVSEILTHLDLLRDERPTQAAILLFGKTPQKRGTHYVLATKK